MRKRSLQFGTKLLVTRDDAFIDRDPLLLESEDLANHSVVPHESLRADTVFQPSKLLKARQTLYGGSPCVLPARSKLNLDAMVIAHDYDMDRTIPGALRLADVVVELTDVPVAPNPTQDT